MLDFEYWMMCQFDSKFRHDFLVKMAKLLLWGRKKKLKIISLETTYLNYLISNFFRWKGRQHIKSCSVLLMSSQEKQSKMHVFLCRWVSFCGNTYTQIGSIIFNFFHCFPPDLEISPKQWCTQPTSVLAP